MIHLLRKFLFAVSILTAAIISIDKPAWADNPRRDSSSLLSMVLAEKAEAERRIVRRLIAGESPSSPAMNEEAHNLRLLQVDALALGYTGDLPALDAPSEQDIAIRVLIHRAGLGSVTPWSILAGRTLSFQRSQD